MTAPAQSSSRAARWLDAITGLGRYGALSVVSFALNLGITALLHEALGLPPEASFAVALVTVFVVNFLGCRYWVFESGTERGAGQQMAMFATSSLGFRGSEYLCFLVLHTVAGLPYLLVAAGVLATSSLVKFGFYRGYVFAQAPRKKA